MSQTVQIYNIEGLGPVVPIDSIRQVLRGLPPCVNDHPAMATAVELVSELIGIGQTAPPVRLVPAVPGGGVAPRVVKI